MWTIVPFESRYQPGFRKMNLEWLDKYGLTESHDLEILDHPQETVIDRGGCIFLALDGEQVIGSAGLWKENEEEYELVKMSVDPGYRGKGIGKILLETCIAEARSRKARKIFLFSNSQLKTALVLYERSGFKQVPVTGAPFLTADVKMELIL